MVAGKYKSRTFRRIFVKTPGGRTVIHYKKRRPSKAQCGKCGAILKGVASERPFRMQNMPKTKNRPERPYGGVLCSECLRRLMIDKARSK